MSLRKQSGNMYGFVSHTWNVVKGRCGFDCAYCYMKRFAIRDLSFDEKELKRDLGSGNFIFVGSSTDMWHPEVPHEWIFKVLQHCREFDNRYLFQSKDPIRFHIYKNLFPENTVLGTTIETNRDTSWISRAPNPRYRADSMDTLKGGLTKFEQMVTIEPILDFDLEPFVKLIRLAKPDWVNIGADSGGNGLPEPSRKKVKKLIRRLEEFTEVRKKSNLGRLMK